VMTQKGSDEWSNFEASFYQFTLEARNIGTSAITSVDIRITLPSLAARISSSYNLYDLQYVDNGVYTARAPLWYLAPQSKGGGSGYTIMVPKTAGPVSSPPTVETLSFNCLYNY
jgi:hypothetical protein